MIGIISNGIQILWSIDLMQVIALGCIKLSLMFFYRTIFNVRGGANLFNAISLATITLIAIWAVAFFFAFLFNCQGNPAANWTSYTLTLQYCWKESAFLLLYSYTDFITDLIVLVFPIPSVNSRAFIFTSRLTGNRSGNCKCL